MLWIYVLVQLFTYFLASLWLFIQLSKNMNVTGCIFELKRNLALYWISRKKRSEIHKLSNSLHVLDESIDGIFRKKSDSNVLCYYGADQKKNFLFVKINRRKNKYMELTIFLSLTDGTKYELPDHPNTVINDIGNSSWSTSNLKITILESSKRTRILFNGILRKGNSSDISCDNDVNYEHVRFNCIFITGTQPYTRTEFWSSNLQAKTLALNSWKASKWQQLINEIDVEEIHQYGSIVGKIIFEDASSIELYLRSLRQCYWGKCDATHFEKNICIIGLDSIGNSFYMNLCDINNGLKNIELGHIKNPIDELHCINSLTFNLKQFFNCYNNGFNEYKFQFTAGNRTYEAIIKLSRKSEKILYGGYPWDSKYKYYYFKMKLNNMSGVGLMHIWELYSDVCPITLPLVKKILVPDELKENSLVYTLSFEDKRCQNKNIIGGKGASLAELFSTQTTKFTIPRGFCITTYALESHIKYYTNLSEAIDVLLKVCSGELCGNIKEHSQKVVKLLENIPVLDTVKTEIFEKLKQLEIGHQESLYAIRSSGVEEDSDETSAAGQNSTFLGIKGAKEILKYITHCWASLYSYQSVEYRRQNGIKINASMGVCVQQMVDADVAGVMFTRHPLTGNPKEIFISSNYGLGETVVSAVVDPDTIIIERSRRNSLSVKTSTIGKKSQKIRMNIDGGGTQITNLLIEETSKLSITLDEALKLAEVGLILDQLYNAPRDIEWALFQNHLYVLQCRPVTALDLWSDFELIHELGSGVPSDSDILTFSNVGEVLPMVLTPLTLSTVLAGLNISTESNIVRKPVLHTYTNHLFIANMRCTLNYINLLLRFVEEKISQGLKVMEIAICGHSIITPEIHEMAKKRNGVLKLTELLKQRTAILIDLWWNSEKVTYANNIVEQCRTTPVVKYLNEIDSTKEIIYAVENLLDNFIRVSNSHSHTSKCSIFYQVLIMSILTEGSEDFTMEHYSDIAVLLGSCSDVISAQVPVVLKNITRTIRESGFANEFKSVDLSEVMSWLLLKCPKAYGQVQEFINVHGHRGIEEFELITETWSMKPEKFLFTIQSMIDSLDANHSDKDLSPRETVARLKTPRKLLTRWILGLLLPTMRQAVAQRETTKALTIEMVHNLRLAYRRLAFLLMREGRLPDEALVFFLTHKELKQLTEKPNPGLVRKAMRRVKIRLQLQSYKYNEVNYGILTPMERTEISTADDELCIQGTSVCNGVATGRACVALNLEEAAEITPGDILITNATDIGWSPYFPLLAGVVTELGGLISHGAVVAREYGLPCIVSAENATRKFKTGEIVLLNGYTGIIKVMKNIQDTS